MLIVYVLNSHAVNIEDFSSKWLDFGAHNYISIEILHLMTCIQNVDTDCT